MDENQQNTTEHFSDVLKKQGVDIMPFTSQDSPSKMNNMMKKYARYLSALPPAALLALANPKIGRPRKNPLPTNSVSIQPINQTHPSASNSTGYRDMSDMPRRKVGRPVGWRKNRDFQMQQNPVNVQRKKAGRPKGWRKPTNPLPMPMPLPMPLPLPQSQLVPCKEGFVDYSEKKKRGRPRLSEKKFEDDSNAAQPPDPIVSYIDDGGHFLLLS
uniref:Uncharacterized protein n=1 Tax=Cacopsylla melanoneura TaxID=428564 RepID=A0A8D8SQS8_9HEMI